MNDSHPIHNTKYTVSYFVLRLLAFEESIRSAPNLAQMK